jgi:hypothetical protein
MNLRKTQAGAFAGTVAYKVRRISTGLFFKPEYRNPAWEIGGRVYKTLTSARSAARHASERNAFGGSSLIPEADVEVVEFHVVEVATHRP